MTENAGNITVNWLLRKFETIAEKNLRLDKASPDNFLSANNTTVIFTSAGICRFHNLILTNNTEINSYVVQWCFRNRNFNLLQKKIVPEWSSTFQQFCAIVDYNRLTEISKTFIDSLKYICDIFGCVLFIKVFSGDKDLCDLYKVTKNINFEFYDECQHFRHKYGEKILTGRNMNIYISHPKVNPRVVGNIIIIEKDENPTHIEVAIGIETLLSALKGKESSLACTPLFKKDIKTALKNNDYLIDSLQIITHLILYGIRPFSSNRGRILRKHIDLFLDGSREYNLDVETTLRIALKSLSQIHNIAISKGKLNTIIDYMNSRYKLNSNSSLYETNKLMSKIWPQRWRHGSEE